MPSYSGPPPAPWIPRPESAFRPMRAWLPCDGGGSFREFVRGDHAAITGTAAWGVGSYGRCFLGNGSSFGVSATFPGVDALSVTIVHISGANPYRGLAGWGANFQGILYSGPRISLIDSNTAERFSANLTAPTASWRVITLTVAGHAAGSAAEFWSDGVRASSGAISSAAGILSPAGQFWIGAVRGGTNPWQSGIGPVLLHDRVLSGKEIAALHADPWRILRDFRWQTGRRIASIPPPQALAGVGQVAPAAAVGSLTATQSLAGVGLIAPASANGSLIAAQVLEGIGQVAPVAASGSVGTIQVLAGVGQVEPARAVGLIRTVPTDALSAVIAYALETPELATSVGAIRWERAPERALAPYLTIREIATQWRAHSELGGIEGSLLELRFTHDSLEGAKALARAWTRGPRGLDRAAIPFGDGGLLALQRESGAMPLPPPSSTDRAGNQLRAVVVQYRAIIERY